MEYYIRIIDATSIKILIFVVFFYVFVVYGNMVFNVAI